MLYKREDNGSSLITKRFNISRTAIRCNEFEVGFNSETILMIYVFVVKTAN